MEYNEIIDIIKSKDLKNVYPPLKLELAIQEVEQAILNYCSIPVVPQALKFIVCNMTLDLLKYQLEINKPLGSLGLEDIDIADVSGIKIGDTSIDIGGSRVSNTNSRKKILNSHSAQMDDILMNYRQQLNMFRRLW